MRTRIAMRALIDDEGLAQRARVDLVRAEHIYKVDLAFRSAIENARHIAALDETEIERGDAACGGVQHIESVPAAFGNAASGTDHARLTRELRGERKDRRAIGPRNRAGTENEHGALRVFQHFREVMTAIRERAKRCRIAAEILDRIGLIHRHAEARDLQAV